MEDDSFSHSLQNFSLDEVSGLPMPLMGDFYRDSNEVTRGLSLPTGGLGGLPMDDSSFSFKGGDFYGGEPDVVRGLTLPADFDHYTDGLDPDFLKPGFGLLEASKSISAGTSGKSTSAETSGKSTSSSVTKGAAQFMDGDRALPVPTDPFFVFEVTTLCVLCDRPFLLMNCLLEFLREGQPLQAVSISKVNPAKCCIKADVFIENMKCTTKVKGYQQEPGKLGLEFQRRSGDSIAFAGLYRLAAQHIQSKHFVIVKGMPEDSIGFLAPPPPLPGWKVDLQDVGPLLDMASSIYSPNLQAESAAALAALTSDQEVADALCSEPGPLQDMMKLLEADRPDINLPAGTLMSNLARSHNAAAHFEDRLQLLLDKVRRLPNSSTSNDAGFLAKAKYAEAFAAATKSCRQRLSANAAGQLAGEVQDLLQDPTAVGASSCIYGNLNEAYSTLACPVY